MIARLALSLGIAVTGVAAAYAVTALYAVLLWRYRQARRAAPGSLPSPAPAVTVLKPLCGEEPGLYECLRSFCEQRYPRLQIVFGVRDPQDPALEIVRRLEREHPELDLACVVDSREHGASLKVSNLINMMEKARHDLIVLADADVRVPSDYLARVIAPLADPAVGIVTCPYRGIARTGGASALLAAFVNEWFMPSVHVAALFGSRAFAFGSTIALRRATLEAIGGFAAIADQLADDYRLGELTRLKGLRTVLSQVEVDTDLNEPDLSALVRHELRWLRTIRAVRPAGYAFSCITFDLPFAALGCVLATGSPPALALLAVTAAARLMLHFAVRRSGFARSQLRVALLNDVLAFALWCWGFASRRVDWRHTRYAVARDGSVRPLP